VGLIENLRLGHSTIVAHAGRTKGAKLKVVNHPLSGPLFTGPQIQPWTCEQCASKPVVTFHYLPRGAPNAYVNLAGTPAGFGFQPYDPEDPPADSDIETVTTDTGESVPFIVRREVGYLDRDQYAFAVLWLPGKPWTPAAPQAQFNRKLALMHGGGCDTGYAAGTAPDVMNPTLLGHGFAIASHALDNAGHACHIALQAESLIMTKELVVERLGPIRWTIGSGCSGGALTQQWVANAYPGVYQAITVACSFTDAVSSGMQYVDYTLLLAYYEDPSRWSAGTSWGPAEIAAVMDHPNPANPVSFTAVIANSADPSRPCPGVPAGQVYDREANPGGVKCTLQDYMVNVFGKRPDGFAHRPVGNDGIQYGLEPLLAGQITPAQFVDVNVRVGGIDEHGDIVERRSTADPLGVARAYRSGAANTASNLDQVAIIDMRGPDPGIFHDAYRTYAMRARLLRNFGTADNQVIWRSVAPMDVTLPDPAVLAADRWIARVQADPRKVPLAQKLREDKPGDLTERCTDGAGHDVAPISCDNAVALYGTPRMAAGMPMTDDTLDCELKPLRRDDYGAVTFTDEQWAQLVQTFPRGVCDYSRPGKERQPTVPWLTYQDAKGRAIHGGAAMAPEPRSTRLKRRRTVR
jgi:hypothetical protein